ncbi:putative MFS alpha-glucoside transporter [Aspergillus affinis]|uniref:putative MFS alpha-glucoside transporter n=1 Tax=Aspergillus affinis TaxID=1070780 RepID=UPI0022FF0F8D|nr:general substrate transporter [Aspergillus affinis]KAI9035741.1 general substrate transporter [Aspergillus affinis]
MKYNLHPSVKAPPVEHVESVPEDLKASDAEFDAAAKGQAPSGYETLGVIDTIKKFKLCTAVCFAMAFSAATDGYQIGINASIIANSGFVDRFATEIGKDGSPALASPILSGWSSIMSCGQILGMTSLAFISSRFGRKVAMYLYWLILVGSVIAECLARSWPVWLIAKLLAGMGVGGVQSTVPTYISEVAPVRIRGGLLMCYSLWWTLGSFFAQVALQHLSHTHPGNYLTPIYTQWAQLGLMFLIYIIVPESPVWCVNVGKYERAKKQLRTLYRGVTDYNLEQQFQVIVLSVEHEKAVAVEQRREKWYSIFRGTDGLHVGLAANGATGWGYIGEISSQRLRPYTAGFAAAATCVIGVVMNVLVPYMTNENKWNWGLKTGWFYVGVGFPFTLGMWFLIPETKGRSAAELDELFERKIKPWQFHKTETATQTLVQMNELRK